MNHITPSNKIVQHKACSLPCTLQPHRWTLCVCVSGCATGRVSASGSACSFTAVRLSIEKAMAVSIYYTAVTEGTHGAVACTHAIANRIAIVHAMRNRMVSVCCTQWSVLSGLQITGFSWTPYTAQSSQLPAHSSVWHSYVHDRLHTRRSLRVTRLARYVTAVPHGTAVHVRRP